jgi:hypothetical protein
VLACTTYPFSPIRLSKTRLGLEAEMPVRAEANTGEVWLRRSTSCRRRGAGVVVRLTLFIWLVEIAGIEPATSGLQSRRSPN